MFQPFSTFSATSVIRNHASGKIQRFVFVIYHNLNNIRIFRFCFIRYFNGRSHYLKGRIRINSINKSIYYLRF